MVRTFRWLATLALVCISTVTALNASSGATTNPFARSLDFNLRPVNDRYAQGHVLEYEPTSGEYVVALSLILQPAKLLGCKPTRQSYVAWAIPRTARFLHASTYAPIRLSVVKIPTTEPTPEDIRYRGGLDSSSSWPAVVVTAEASSTVASPGKPMCVVLAGRPSKASIPAP